MAVLRANDAVAEALFEYADLLAMSGGNAFKVRVYEKAARSVAGYPTDVATLDIEGLEAIPGVGKSIAAKMLEFETHGSFAELDTLRARIPAGVRARLGVPGLGPKRAMVLHDRLGISSVSELLDALHHHGLRKLKGFETKLPFGRFSLDLCERAMWLAETLLGAHLDDDELRTTIGIIASTADEFGDRISRLFGGGLFNHASDTEMPEPSSKPGTGGYLWVRAHISVLAAGRSASYEGFDVETRCEPPGEPGWREKCS